MKFKSQLKQAMKQFSNRLNQIKLQKISAGCYNQ